MKRWITVGYINHFGWPMPSDDSEESIFRPEEGFNTKPTDETNKTQIFRSENDSDGLNPHAEKMKPENK